jgi:quercetin dioxygenase-like cupin family protein
MTWDPERLARDTGTIREGRAEGVAKTNLFESPRFFVDVHVLRPGQSHRPHRHAGEDKVYHVLSGRGVVLAGGRQHRVGPGWTVWCPEGDDHGVTNEGPEDLRLLVFMAPHPRAAAAVQ